MRSLGLAALLLLAGLAGCIGQDTIDEDPEEQLDTAATGVEEDLPTPSLEMTGCSEQLGIFPIVAPPGMAELPEGFESENLLYIFATECRSPAAEASGTVAQLQGGLFVTPPSELAHDDAVAHALPFGAFVSDANVSSIFTEWNLGQVVEGDVTVELLADTPAARAGHALGGDGSFTVHMYSEATVPVEGEPGLVRFFGVEDGTVTNAVDMTWTGAQAAQGEATYAFEGDAAFLPPPAEPGIVEHWWGEDYAFSFEHVAASDLAIG